MHIGVCVVTKPSNPTPSLRLDINPLPLLYILAHPTLYIIDILYANDLITLPPRFQILHSSKIESHSLPFFIEGCTEVLTKLDKLRS